VQRAVYLRPVHRAVLATEASREALMMSVQRYQQKPQVGQEVQVAARYEPGQPLDDLRAVAVMADGNAELAEVRFCNTTILLVRWKRIPDDHPAEIEYETVEPGRFLAYSYSGDFLYEADEGNWRQFYDLVSDGQPSDVAEHVVPVDPERR
jgi:hypothetical protein